MIAVLMAAQLLALNPDVTQATVGTTICVHNWTATVRPPASYTNALKRQQLPAGADPHSFEEDHYTPLCLGGAPRDPVNLRPEPWPEARRKDRDERTFCRAVCAGSMTLEDAQAGLAAKWPRP